MGKCRGRLSAAGIGPAGTCRQFVAPLEQACAYVVGTTRPSRFSTAGTLAEVAGAAGVEGRPWVVAGWGRSGEVHAPASTTSTAAMMLSPRRPCPPTRHLPAETPLGLSLIVVTVGRAIQATSLVSARDLPLLGRRGRSLGSTRCAPASVTSATDRITGPGGHPFVLLAIVPSSSIGAPNPGEWVPCLGFGEPDRMAEVLAELKVARSTLDPCRSLGTTPYRLNY